MTTARYSQAAKVKRTDRHPRGARQAKQPSGALPSGAPSAGARSTKATAFWGDPPLGIGSSLGSLLADCRAGLRAKSGSSFLRYSSGRRANHEFSMRAAKGTGRRPAQPEQAARRWKLPCACRASSREAQRESLKPTESLGKFPRRPQAQSCTAPACAGPSVHRALSTDVSQQHTITPSHQRKCPMTHGVYLLDPKVRNNRLSKTSTPTRVGFAM